MKMPPAMWEEPSAFETDGEKVVEAAEEERALHGGHDPDENHEPHEEHEDHEHGDDCGHEAVEHDDHVDYLHEGHRHFFHDGHWDEH